MAQKAGWVAMLRAVNVGGNGKVPMAGLRELAVSLGFEGVKTIVNSGNLAFRAQAKSAAALESKISAGCQEKFGVATDALVRGEQEWAAVIAANPFLEEAKSDPARLVVMPLHHEPTAEALTRAVHVLSGRPGRHEVDDQADREVARHHGHRPQLEHGAEAARRPRLERREPLLHGANPR
jgi:uncharacterized protein (DUF1697 family)